VAPAAPAVVPEVHMVRAPMLQARVVAPAMLAIRRLRPTARNIPHRSALVAAPMHQAVSRAVPEVLVEEMIQRELSSTTLVLLAELARQADMRARTALAVRGVPVAAAAAAALEKAKLAARAVLAARGARVLAA